MTDVPPPIERCYNDAIPSGRCVLECGHVGRCKSEDQAEIEQLRGNLSLAEEGLANYAQENKELKERLERIEQERLTWAMTCECYCPACTALDKLIRRHVP